ncbi:MAG: HAMP domain-containing histidine kinase [Anaerolineales bacterium]|nr:HAMP domain-containing histidine kinase [Anaerolineales bacterium]
MRHGRHPRHRPGWWPENEPWPPAHRRRPNDLQRMPRAFFWRLAGLLVFLTLLAGFGCVLATGALSVAQGWLQAPTQAVPIWSVCGASLLLAGLATAAIGMRRLLLPLRDLADAVSQVESGNLNARVVAGGPGELRALAHAFNRMTARLQRTEQQRRNLLADIHHELQTPLTVLQGNLEAMLDGVYPADEAHLSALMEETRLLSRLVDDMRVLSDLESGVLRLHREPTDLVRLVEELRVLFGPQARQRRVDLVVTTAAQLPPADVDPVRVQQVLANLLSNALRHALEGGEIRLSLQAAENGWIPLQVGDTGVGIAPGDIDHVFDRAYRSTDSGGRGLGLTIAKSLVEAHGGEISVESVPGRGTTVRFTLPVKGDD